MVTYGSNEKNIWVNKNKKIHWLLWAKNNSELTNFQVELCTTWGGAFCVWSDHCVESPVLCCRLLYGQRVLLSLRRRFGARCLLQFLVVFQPRDAGHRRTLRLAFQRGCFPDWNEKDSTFKQWLTEPQRFHFELTPFKLGKFWHCSTRVGLSW